MKKVFIAESADDLAGFREYCGRSGIDPGEFSVVTLEPSAKAACRERGIPCTDTLPFFDSESQRRVLAASHRLTSLALEKLSFPVSASLAGALADSFIFYSRFYINNFLWIIEVLKGIRSEWGDIECAVYRKAAGDAAGTFPYLAAKDRFVDSLAEKYCRGNGLKVTVASETGFAAPAACGSRNTRMEKLFRSAARILFIRKLKRLSRLPTIFIAAPYYNLDRLSRDIQKRFPRVLVVFPVQAPVSVKGTLNGMLREVVKFPGGKGKAGSLVAAAVPLLEPPVQNAGLEAVKAAYRKFAAASRERFVHENCCFWEEFDRKVQVDLLPALAGLLDAAAGQRAFLGTLKPRLVLSPVSVGAYQCWGEVSRSLGIPALVVPQKSLLKPSDEFARLEERYIGRAQVSDSFAHAAAQSPLVSEYLQWSGYRGHIIESGPLIFARPDAGQRREKREFILKGTGADGRTEQTRIIVWAPSMKTRRSRRFYVLESGDELLAAMADVFAAVAQLKDVHLVFRIHPGGALTGNEIRALLPVPANVSISDAGRFEDVIAAADLLISFSSTAIQEALVNFIPVLLYDRWKRYNHLDAGEVSGANPAKVSPVYYVNDRERLGSSLEWILREHATKAVPRELFARYVFLDPAGKLEDFMNFVERCMNG